MSGAIAAIIEGRARDLGGFFVARLLPSKAMRSVGPFVFFDHMGPASLPPGTGIDVRPHPHIGLATVTYLFEGGIVHRDSLGFVQPIEPGAINWMTAGRGIAHSERTGDALRKTGSRLHGCSSGSRCRRRTRKPRLRSSITRGDAAGNRARRRQLRVLAGSAYGAASPCKRFRRCSTSRRGCRKARRFRAARTHRTRSLRRGRRDRVRRRAIAAPRMIVFARGSQATLSARTDAHVMLLGGDPLDGERHLWWNFVSSSRERIEQAKRDWAEGRFAQIPGETERIPLPDL
jgi:redox-sensitive bicupin YhaK (pirin superfamily)